MEEVLNEGLIRKDILEKDRKKMVKYREFMGASLAEVARTKGGLNLLRFLLHESGFLAPLTHETSVGVNKDVLVSNEAKRNMYLGLRVNMDWETITIVEKPDPEPEEKTEEENDGE